MNTFTSLEALRATPSGLGFEPQCVTRDGATAWTNRKEIGRLNVIRSVRRDSQGETVSLVTDGHDFAVQIKHDAASHIWWNLYIFATREQAEDEFKALAFATV